ncbi:Uncharacterized protein FWK35_00036669, partial [Aphis craccivora]
ATETRVFTHTGDGDANTHITHAPALGQSAHVMPQAGTEAVDKDSEIMAVNADDQTASVAVQNQLSRSDYGNTTNNGTRTRPDKIPTPAVELEFPSGFVTAILDSQAQKSYVNPIIASKYGKSTPHGPPNTVRMADGHTATTSGTTSFEARIGALDIQFKATILDNLYCDALLGHDFLIDNEVSWDYAACTIHLGRHIHTSTCWNGKAQPPATSPDLSQLEFVSSEKVGRTKLIEHEIVLKDPSPIALNLYPYSHQKQMAIDEMVRDMETQGLVEPSTSPWAAPVVLAKKKDGTFRLCVDYRRLNDVTESDAYPMPDLNKMIRQMRGVKIFSIFDLSRGLFQFRVLPFGLKNSPMTFVRLMNEVMRGYQDDFVQVYLNDIVVFSRDEYEHQAHLDKVLERLKRFGLTCNTKKCKIGLREISFLGHIVDLEGIAKQPEKLVCIDNFPVPKKVRDVRKFLGVCNWYNQFVVNYADTIVPHTNLLKQGVWWKWTDVEQR